ncbi:MAG: hypothetical protein K2K82_00990 [Muribaculaceae bacterium]|nr:hypothetical protein [Muribaculaceae bacterium]
MQPLPINFYAYCESEAEAKELEKALYDFVDSKRQQGVAVRAAKLTQALTKYKDNFFVTQFLR